MLKAKARKPARFRIEDRCAVLGDRYVWEVVVSGTGMKARRQSDGREVSISWREMIGTAMFYGRDSKRGERLEL